MKKLALFSSIVAVLLLSLCAPQPPLAVAQTAPVTLAFNLKTAGQRLPTINLVGSMSSCSIVVTSAGTFELDPQAASDGIINGVGNPTPSWVTATTVGGGSITASGTYTGQIATIALTSFGGILKTTDGTPVTGSMACSGAIATASGGATGSPGPPGPATEVTSSPGVTVVEVTTSPVPVYQVGVHLGTCLGIVTGSISYTCATPTASAAPQTFAAASPLTYTTPGGVNTFGCDGCAQVPPNSACAPTCTAVILQAPGATPSPQAGFASLQNGLYLHPSATPTAGMPSAVQVWNGGGHCSGGDSAYWGTTINALFGVPGNALGVGCNSTLSTPIAAIDGAGNAAFAGTTTSAAVTWPSASPSASVCTDASSKLTTHGCVGGSGTAFEQSVKNFCTSRSISGCHYWPMNESSGAVMVDAIGSLNGAYSQDLTIAGTFLPLMPMGMPDGSVGVDMWDGLGDVTGLPTPSPAEYAEGIVARLCDTASTTGGISVFSSLSTGHGGQSLFLFQGAFQALFGDGSTFTNPADVPIGSYSQTCEPMLLIMVAFYDGTTESGYWLINNVPNAAGANMIASSALEVNGPGPGGSGNDGRGDVYCCMFYIPGNFNANDFFPLQAAFGR